MTSQFLMPRLAVSTQEKPSASDMRTLPLTSARFVAAIFVVLFHGWFVATEHKSDHDVVSRIIGLGYVSVSFFFMLSGFILVVVYLHQDHKINRRLFFVSRLARIYPLYVTAMLLPIAHFLLAQRHALHSHAGHTTATVLASLFLIQAWFPSMHGINDPSWSLSAEAFFYLLFPLIAELIAKLSTRVIMLVSPLVYFGGMYLIYALHVQDPYNPMPHLFIFVLGIALAQLYRWIGMAPKRRLFVERWAPGMLLACILTFLAIPLLQVPTSVTLMQHGLLAPVFGMAILALSSGNSCIQWLFARKELVTLGEASFGLYIMHEPMFMILRRFVEAGGPGAYLIYVSTTVILSVISLKYLEIPARRWVLKQEKVWGGLDTLTYRSRRRLKEYVLPALLFENSRRSLGHSEARAAGSQPGAIAHLPR